MKNVESQATLLWKAGMYLSLKYMLKVLFKGVFLEEGMIFKWKNNFCVNI